jgi:phage terminase large subunit
MTVEAPPQHFYKPRGAALELFARHDPEILVSGPAGTGKSRAVLEKINVMALENPGMRGLMLRKTGVSFTSSGLVTWKRYVIPELIEVGAVEYYGGSREEPAQYRYANGSAIVLGGMDKASKIMSTDYDVIFVQEAIELTLDDWESLTTRLRNDVVSFQQIIGDTNPAEDTHWLKKRCDADNTAILHSRHEDNPLLYDDDGELTEKGAAYIAKLDALTGVRYRRLRLGEWSSAEGVVYEEWDSAVHLIDPFEVPDDWPRYWSIDFGFTNPFVCQWWAEDPDGRLYLYREWYRTQWLVSEHVTAISAAVTATYDNTEWIEPKPRAIICDHDAEGRAQLVHALGIGTVTAKKAVADGIQAVKARLKVAGDGKPRLFVMRDALIERDPLLVEATKPTSFVEEIGAYVWDQRPGKPPKEEPIKKDDHGLDCARYIVAHLDPLGQKLPSVRYM